MYLIPTKKWLKEAKHYFSAPGVGDSSHVTPPPCKRPGEGASQAKWKESASKGRGSPSKTGPKLDDPPVRHGIPVKKAALSAILEAWVARPTPASPKVEVQHWIQQDEACHLVKMCEANEPLWVR